MKLLYGMYGVDYEGGRAVEGEFFELFPPLCVIQLVNDAVEGTLFDQWLVEIDGDEINASFSGMNDQRILHKGTDLLWRKSVTDKKLLSF